MSKRKGAGTKEDPLVINMDQELNRIVSQIEIKSAQIKDLFCNYSYELKAGTGEGDSINRKGASIIHDDMKAAFQKLKVHLALICEEIKTDEVRSDIESFGNIDSVIVYDEGSLEERISKFYVTAFRLDDNGEGSVQLVGSKTLSTGDSVELKTPKISWEGGYAFIQELRVVIDDLVEEVEAYMNGKSAPKFVQQEMEFDNGEEEEG